MPILAVIIALGSSRLPIQGPGPSSAISSRFGTVTLMHRSADSLWGERLVDTFLLSAPVDLGFMPQASRPATQDLFNRMNRPVVADALETYSLVKSSGPKDDLALGIAFWTLQWQACSDSDPHESRLHDLAEHYLLKASRTGDEVQKSFASLAYAYCAIRSAIDQEKPDYPVTIGSHFERIRVYEKRLISVYKRFKKTVPERSLRAGRALLELYGQCRDSKAYGAEEELLRREFKSFRKWGSYPL